MKTSPQVIINDEYEPIDTISRLGIVPRAPEEDYIAPEKVYVRPEWKYALSIFRDFKHDTHKMVDRCFEVDFAGTRIARIVKRELDIQNVKDMLYSIYKSLKDCYRYFSAIGAPSEIWSIPMNTYTDFCLNAGIIDGKLLKLSDFDRVFIATYTKTEKERNHRNPDRALVRYQFMEGLVRLADQKYTANGITSNFPDAVRMMVEDIRPFLSKYDHEKWRIQRYWNENVDAVLKSYSPILRGAYKKYSGAKTLPGQRKFMSLDEFNKLINEMGLLNSNDNFGERDATLFYNLSMMTQVDELHSDRIYQMQFVEFLEAFSRVADKYSAPAYGQTEWDMTTEQRVAQSLCLKLEGVMTRLYACCPNETKDVWLLPDTTIFDLEETKGKVRYNTVRRRKLVRIDPCDPSSYDAYGILTA